MKINNLVNSATRTFNRAGLKLKKHSPEIMVTAGVIGVVASAIMACKATTKASSIVDEMKEEIDKIHKAADMVDEEIYSEEDLKKDTSIVYIQTGVKFAKLYGPSIAFGALSITSILVGHNILRKRNLALAAAYTAIDTSFKAYRGRVVERFGKELDKELRYNIKAKEVEETVIDEKTGKEKVVNKTIDVVDPNEYSDYARFFDDGCNGWSKDPEFNLMFLKQQQSYANDLLKTRGHLFLNEVYDLLGIQRTKAGNIVGWIYDEKNPVGDNFVDFGIYDINRPKNRDFVNGYERTIILDFNVDGDILSLM